MKRRLTETKQVCFQKHSVFFVTSHHIMFHLHSVFAVFCPFCNTRFRPLTHLAAFAPLSLLQYSDNCILQLTTETKPHIDIVLIKMYEGKRARVRSIAQWVTSPTNWQQL